MVAFAEALRGGLGRVEYIFHVAGMPWAVSTWQFPAGTLSSANLQTMFGSEHYNTTSHFADVVDIWPFLQTPGPQMITNDDAMAKLDSGTWTAKISDLPPGDPSWPFSARITASGLEGLQSIANPRIDRSIKSARIATTFPKLDTSLSFIDDDGGRLGTACAAASSAAPVVVWIGGEAMSVSGGTSSGTVGTATIEERGILGSVEQYHAPNKTLTGAPSIRVSDAPLNGIGNRPCNLWAVVLDSSNSVISGPVKFRHGKVSGDISYDGGAWSVQVLPWWRWLDTELSVPACEAPMDKFVLSRWTEDEVDDHFWTGDAAELFKNRNPPHIILCEYDSGTADRTSVDIWLCNEGTSVVYDTVAELEDAIITAMNAASPHSWTYARSNIGPISADVVDDDVYSVGGDIPLLLQWGDWDRAVGQTWPTGPMTNSGFYDVVTASYLGPVRPDSNWFTSHAYESVWAGANAINTPQKALEMQRNWISKIVWDGSSGGAYYDAYSAGNSEFASPRPKPTYILQWGFAADTLGGTEFSWQQQPMFPMPREAGGEARLYINQDYDVQGVDAASYVQIGSEDTDFPVLAAEYESYTVEGWTSLSRALVASVGAGGASNNYLVLDSAEGYQTASGNPAIRAIDCGGFDVNNLKFLVGQTLFGHELSNHDYWGISQTVDINSQYLSRIFKAILGHPVTASVPESIQADHVPDYDTIDWSSLDLAVNDGLSFDTYFRFHFSGKVNLWSLLNEELKFYGLTPTWEWSSNYEKYRMKFKRLAIVNASAAMFSGRVLDDSVTSSVSKISCEHASAWQINAMDVSANYRFKTDDFAYVFPVMDESGYAPTGGKINSLEIAPKITRIPGLSTSNIVLSSVISYLSAFLENTMDPRPSAKIDATLAKFMDFGVGTDFLLTAGDIRDPFMGSVGVENWPSSISEITVDPSSGKTSYKAVLGARRTYGWAPSVLITVSTHDGDVVTVTHVEGSGQEFSGTNTTDGWQDHWFFADYTYNSSVSTPTAGSSGNYLCTLVERNSKTPAVITGVEVTYCNPHTYAVAHGAAETILTLDHATGYDETKEWYLVYERYSQALEDPQREWIYIADSDLQIEHPSTGHETGREWT